MKIGFNWWTRKLHRWGALLTAVPLLLVIVSGLILQLKKEWAWVQPPSQKGSGPVEVQWSEILEAARAVPEAEIETWDDIDRLDVRPGKSLIKIQAKNHWELQINWNDGKLLSSTYRRSDWLESLHDGSFFGDISKSVVFLVNGLVLLGLWLTGVYLWYLPIGVKRKKKQKQKARSRVETTPSNPDA